MAVKAAAFNRLAVIYSQPPAGLAAHDPSPEFLAPLQWLRSEALRHSWPINVIDHEKKGERQTAIKMHLVRETLQCDELLRSDKGDPAERLQEVQPYVEAPRAEIRVHTEIPPR